MTAKKQMNKNRTNVRFWAVLFGGIVVYYYSI